MSYKTKINASSLCAWVLQLKTGNESCCIISDTSFFFLYKIFIPAVSMACPHHTHLVSGHIASSFMDTQA